MSSTLAQTIYGLTEKYYEEMVQIRRHLHQHPELSFHESETSKFIASFLSQAGIEHKTNVGGHGIVGYIYGKNSDKNSNMIALRADIDALPITEEIESPFKSLVTGVSHCCGHDIHTTCLLGAAKILQEVRDQFEGTVMLIFQPAEETIPGGALAMIKDGLFDEKLPSCIIGQHTGAFMEPASIGISDGPIYASSDEIIIEIVGKGGHAARPNECINPLIITSKFLLTIEEKYMKPYESVPLPQKPWVLVFGKIEMTDGAYNCIAERCKVHGTLRAYDDEIRKTVLLDMKRICNEICEEYKGHANINIQYGYPSLSNHVEMAEMIRNTMKQVIGEDKVTIGQKVMGAEDFAYYSKVVPAVYWRLGIGSKSYFHSPKFEAQEISMMSGISGLAYTATQLVQTITGQFNIPNAQEVLASLKNDTYYNF